MRKISKLFISIIVIAIIAVGLVIFLSRIFLPINKTALPLENIKNAVSLINDVSYFIEHSNGTYLFILQNSDEMRPTGGFIGTYGLITVKDGRVTDFFTDDVYNLDRFVPAEARPFAPEPIQTYLEQPRWYLRDANWSPDFPTSAEQILRFYKEESFYISENRKQKTENGNPSSVLRPQSSDIAGVIAIMPEAIRPLLKVVGPISAGGQIFNADNLTDILEYEVEIGFEPKGISSSRRKSIISELGYKLIDKVIALPLSKRIEMIKAIQTALNEKHILVYANDPAIQTALELNGWDGKIKNAPLDYLAIFDANMFSMKTDPYVSKDIFYKVYQKGSALIGETEIIYSYPKAGPAWKTKGYRTWTRVYVPQGSILQKAYGAMKQEGSAEAGEVTVEQEFNKTVFGAFIAVQAGETKKLKFVYRLPDYVNKAMNNGAYELLAQKQPGTLGHNLTVSADFGKVAKQWSPADLSIKHTGTELIWKTSLKKDQEFRLEF